MRAMSDAVVANVLFGVGFVLMILSMVLGPFEITRWAVLSACLACCFALGAAAIAFPTWEEPKGERPDAEKEKRDDLNK